MKNRIVVSLFLLSLTLLVACGTTPEPTSPTSVATVAESPLPTPTVAPTEATPEASGMFASPVPTPSGDYGVVTGTLLRGNPPEPVQRYILYLGEIITEDGGTPVMAGVDKSVAPKSTIDPAGRFLFEQVPPGEYVLIVDTISSTLILRDPDTGEDMYLQVKAGEITDLGELVYSDLSATP